MTTQWWLEETPPPEVPGVPRLTLLLDDAAARAAALLRGEPEPVSDDPLADAVRILAGPGGHEFVAEAARQTGLPEDELRRLVLAHRHGGSTGVLTALAPAPVDPEEAVREIRARRGLAGLAAEPGVVTDLAAKVQVRHGADGRWYPFTLWRDRWWPATGATISPGAAFRAALRARRAR
ncbi:hypothetical protein ACFHYQ_18150 [Sphaerimonospora cavernae]|uniref:Uncharacterized protein n=1 Tax=Sphaerimonospora cavernae TaxID=1740611 RepID=A0ABV6U8G4_9ACTN